MTGQGYGPDENQELAESFKESEASQEVRRLFKLQRARQRHKGLSAILRLKERSADLRKGKKGGK
jgi:hypothetical protein